MPVIESLISPLRPKVIGRIKQKKIAAREHLRAVLNCLSQLELDLAVPQEPLKRVDPTCEVRLFHGNAAFRWNKVDGTAKWDTPTDRPGCAGQHLRLVLHADEGSPLFSAVMFLHSRNVAVQLVRDELCFRESINILLQFLCLCLLCCLLIGRCV